MRKQYIVSVQTTMHYLGLFFALCSCPFRTDVTIVCGMGMGVMPATCALRPGIARTGNFVLSLSHHLTSRV